MNLSLIGPSGAGKGTYSATLVKELWLDHVSTGDLLRQNLRDQTPLGLFARRYMDQAELVPDEVDRKSTRLNSSHSQQSRMPSSA